MILRKLGTYIYFRKCIFGVGQCCKVVKMFVVMYVASALNPLAWFKLLPLVTL